MQKFIDQSIAMYEKGRKNYLSHVWHKVMSENDRANFKGWLREKGSGLADVKEANGEVCFRAYVKEQLEMVLEDED